MEINNELFNFDLVGLFEPIQYIEYHSKNLGKCDWHIDTDPADINTYVRKLTGVILLDDPEDFEGGIFQIRPFYKPIID